jgi:hypothetical protein
MIPLGLTRPTSVDSTSNHMPPACSSPKALEEIIQNQAHPSNLVAVRSAKTPVFASPSQGAKVLFLAAAEDEFEILDSNSNWVHVRISGLSRGWVRRSNLEMPKTDSDVEPVESGKEVATEKEEGKHSPPSAEQRPFQVQSEQIASFPGSWAPLRGKTVNIISVQKIAESATDTGSAAKLAFTRTLYDKAYLEIAKGSTGIDGVVVIFDSDDGGMTAATVAILRQWKTGTLSEDAFWRRCFFDPPEAFRPTSSQ